MKPNPRNPHDTPFAGAAALAVGLALSISACSTMKVSTLYDPESVAMLKTYKTYTWLPDATASAAAPTETAPSPRELVAPIVRRAVDQELQAKGYRLVEEGPADFRIGWFGAVADKVDISSYDTAYGYGWGAWYGPFPYTTGGVDVREYEQGTLILSSVDTASNKLVWRGAARAEIKPGLDGTDLEKKIKKAVDKMLDRFPPA